MGDSITNHTERNILYCILFVTLVLFSPALLNDFAWDDTFLLTENQYLHDRSQWSTFILDFSSALAPGGGSLPYFRPITSMSYIIEYSLFGLNPFWFHLSNITMHLANVFLVFYLLHLLIPEKKKVRLVATLLFAIHPVHTESIVWISGRTDMLAMLFGLLSLVLYVKWNKNNSLLWFWGSVAAFVMALLSKEIAMTLVPFFALYHIVFEKMTISKYFDSRAKFILPYVVMSIISLMISSALEGGMRILSGSETIALANISTTLYHIALRYGRYLLYFVFPYPLTIFPVSPEVMTPTAQFVLTAIALVALTYVGFKLYARSEKGFFATMFVLCILPYMNLFPSMSSTLAERYFYISSLGLCVCAAYFLVKKFNRRSLIALCTLFTIVSFLIVVPRISMWENSDILFESEALAQPNNPHTTGMFGTHNIKHGDPNLAIEYLEKSIALDPTKPDMALNLINAYLEFGDPDKALQTLGRTSEQFPSWVVPHLMAATIQLDNDETQLAYDIMSDILPKYKSGKYIARNHPYDALIISTSIENFNSLTQQGFKNSNFKKEN